MREKHHIVPKRFKGKETILLSPRAHAIITVLQCRHYNYPLLHRRQLKYLPLELLGEAKYWMSRRGSLSNSMRVNTSRSGECRAKQSESHVEDWKTNLRRLEIVSSTMTETNKKLHECPTCGKLMNIGNLSQHIRRNNCSNHVG